METSSGLVLLCNEQNIITQILRDDLGLPDAASLIGRPLTSLVDRQSFEKALNFAIELQQHKAVFNWEMNMKVGNELILLHFAGIVKHRETLIMAAKTGNGTMRLYQEMMIMSNEQTNFLRSAIKEQIELSRRQTEQDHQHYDEVSRLNNELINLQRELTKKNIELERLNNQKNEFLGMASHDLRNPLTVIITFSDFLLDGISNKLDEDHIKMLNNIRSSSQFMFSLVEDLLDISTIETGKLRLDKQRTDLTALIQQNITLNQVLAAKKQISLQFKQAAQPEVMLLDARKIEQVLNNLISNAIKFSFPHTTIQVTLTATATQLEVSISDEGQGIPAAEIEGLFKPFAKTSVRSTGGEKTTGLGLNIVKRIIEGHQGKFWVESVVGQGSTFYFSLPVPPPQQPTKSSNVPIDLDACRLQLNKLPAAWKSAFAKAIDELNVENARALLSELEAEQPMAAATLTQLLSEFHFDTLETIMNEVLE